MKRSREQTEESKEQDSKEQPPKKKQQIAPSKKWVFTDHDATPVRQAAWKKLTPKPIAKLAFQVEVCPETKKEHLQGVFEFVKRARPTSVIKGPHYEKQRGTDAEAVAYATKTETRKEGAKPFVFGYPEELDKWTAKDMCCDQMLIADGVRGKCPRKDRTVHWYWEAKGNWGKTQMALYMVDQMGAMLLQGASKDCLHGIAAEIEKTGMCPRIIIFDVPRVNQGHVSYQSIEAIKNGCFFSGKYESSMVRFNRPHVIVFSNQPPELHLLSEDRWHIVELGDHTCK